MREGGREGGREREREREGERERERERESFIRVRVLCERAFIRVCVSLYCIPL